MEPFLLSSIGSLGVSLVSSQVEKTLVNPVEKFIKKYVEGDGLLPSIHHLERGTYRAAILACYRCIKKVRPAAKLMHPRGKVEDDRYYGARNQLLLRLKKLEQGLQPANEVGNVAKLLGKPEKARKDCAELFQDKSHLSIAPNLDTAGVRALALQNASKIEGGYGKTRSFTELRQLWAPELSTHLCATLASWGAWPKDRQSEVARVLQEAFFGESEHWLNSFAYFYVEEIRKDPNLHVTASVLRAATAQQALDRVEAGVEAMQKDVAFLGDAINAALPKIKADLSEIKDSIEELTERLHRTQDQSNLGRREIFFRPEGREDTFKPFHFSEEEEGFVGREVVLEWLRDELLVTDKPFAWAAISGPAGMGKSRLAFHITNEHLQSYRYGGFVSESMMSSPLDCLPSSDEIDGPTLLVLDYAGSAPEDCANFLARCALVSSGAQYPVRALVLVRRPDDEFFSQVANGREFGQLRKTQVKDQSPRSRNGEIALTPLDPDDILSLMRSRMASTAKVQAREQGVANIEIRALTDDKLNEALKQYEADEGRPLYALIIADGLQRGMDIVRGEGETIEEARLRLLWDYLTGQYYNRWTPAARLDGNLAEARERLDRHLSFSVLSTFCRGLTDRSWQALFEDPALSDDAHMLLPVHRRHRNSGDAGAALDNRRLLPSILGSGRSARETIYPAIEPDLIGEALLLGLFHDVGEKWSENHGTVEDRRDFLIDLAWHADPNGAAYFANLVAQDFPETAEKLGWLLPKTARQEHEIPRARLLRNLASIILSGFRDKAAAIVDIRRIDRLTRLFDFSDGVAEEAIVQYAQAVAAIAEELSFVINKSMVPSTLLHADPLDDPQKSERRRGFAIASARSAVDVGAQFQSSENAQLYATPTEILKRQSDEKTVQHTIRVLKRIFRTLPNYITRDYGFETRAALFDSLGSCLTSVFWEDRNDRGKFGHAPKKLSEKEREERSAFLADLEALVAGSSYDEETIGLVGGTLYNAMFAEAGTFRGRGDDLYRKLHAYAKEGTFVHMGALAKMVRFLRNYITNQQNRDAKDHDFGETHYEDVVGLARQLFEAATMAPHIERRDCERLVGAFLNVSRRAEKRKEDALDGEADLHPAMAQFLAFCDKHGAHPYGDDTVEFISLFASMSHNREEVAVEQLNRCQLLVAETGFDTQKLNNPFWKTLAWCILNFMKCSDRAWPTSRALIEKLVSDVGKRAREDLRQALSTPNWLNDISADRSTDLVPILEDVPLAEAQIRFGLIGKALLDGNVDHLQDELNRWWTPETTDEAIKQRIFVLQVVMLSLPFLGSYHPSLTLYRDFVLESFRNGSEDALDGVSEALRHSYSVALGETAIRFARLEIAAGGAPEVWIEAVGA